MKTKECPRCRALLVQASTVCATCGTQMEGSGLPPAAVPVPPWLADLADPPGGAPAPPGPDAAASGASPGAVDPSVPPPPPPPGAAGPPPPDAAVPPGYGATGYPPPGYPPPGYGAGYPPPGYGTRATHPQATTAMVLGILSLVVCGIFTAVPAIVIGNRVRREVAASGGALDGDSQAKTGVVCGWVSVAFTAVGVLAFVALVLLGSTVEPESEFQPVELPPVELEEEFPPPTDVGRQPPRGSELTPTTR